MEGVELGGLHLGEAREEARVEHQVQRRDAPLLPRPLQPLLAVDAIEALELGVLAARPQHAARKRLLEQRPREVGPAHAAGDGEQRDERAQRRLVRFGTAGFVGDEGADASRHRGAELRVLGRRRDQQPVDLAVAVEQRVRRVDACVADEHHHRRQQLRQHIEQHLGLERHVAAQVVAAAPAPAPATATAALALALTLALTLALALDLAVVLGLGGAAAPRGGGRAQLADGVAQHGQRRLPVLSVEVERQKVRERLAPRGAAHALVVEGRRREQVHARVDVVELARLRVAGDAQRQPKHVEPPVGVGVGPVAEAAARAEGLLGVEAAQLVRRVAQLEHEGVLPLAERRRREPRRWEVLGEQEAPQQPVLGEAGKMAAAARQRTHVALVVEPLEQDQKRVVPEQSEDARVRLRARRRRARHRHDLQGRGRRRSELWRWRRR